MKRIIIVFVVLIAFSCKMSAQQQIEVEFQNTFNGSHTGIYSGNGTLSLYESDATEIFNREISGYSEYLSYDTPYISQTDNDRHIVDHRLYKHHLWDDESARYKLKSSFTTPTSGVKTYVKAA